MGEAFLLHDHARPVRARTKKKGAHVALRATKDIPIDDLRGQLAGELISSDEPSYDEAREVFFKGVDRRPLAVAQVAGAADVAAVVNAAREGGLELAVRSGGHSRAGYGTVDGGLVIDLSAMDRVEIDADDGTAWVETGATAGKYTLATGERGRATGLGDTGSVGIGGLTLAGGVGFLARKTGLTIDNLLAAEVVTADGQVVQASEDSEPELFWAIRGGEGNFGVATRFQLRLAEVSEIVGGMLILPASPQVITGFLDAAQAAPEELSTIANVLIAPPLPFVPEEAHGKPVMMGQFAYVGPVDQGEQVIAPFRALAEPLADMVRPMRYPELYEGPEPEARFGAGTNFFADSLEPAAAEAMLEQLPKSTAPMRAVQLRVLGGALARVPNDATAFAHRDRGLFVNVAAMYVDAGEKDTHDAWINGLANSLGKDGAGGYVGFLGEEDEATIRAAYPGATWDRLREVKRRYDPDNLFHLNHNIPPADG
jgi:FAD/FMN-containing dehydrogenase